MDFIVSNFYLGEFLSWPRKRVEGLVSKPEKAGDTGRADEYERQRFLYNGSRRPSKNFVYRDNKIVGRIDAYA